MSFREFGQGSRSPHMAKDDLKNMSDPVMGVIAV